MLRSPGYTPPAVAVDGDKVLVIRKHGHDDGLTGYQLPAPPGIVRLAAEAADDNRADPPDDWWRAEYDAADVYVSVLQRRDWTFV